MKFSCEQCGTRYSIADQKVEGKRLRIRCKVCSFIMDVRGSALGMRDPLVERPAPTPPAPEPQIDWYVAEGGNPVGPLSFEKLSADIKARRLSRDVLVWNETFTDWQSAADVPELARLIPPPLPVAETSREIPLADPVSQSEFETNGADGDDPMDLSLADLSMDGSVGSAAVEQEKDAQASAEREISASLDARSSNDARNSNYEDDPRERTGMVSLDELSFLDDDSMDGSSSNIVLESSSSEAPTKSAAEDFGGHTEMVSLDELNDEELNRKALEQAAAEQAAAEQAAAEQAAAEQAAAEQAAAEQAAAEQAAAEQAAAEQAAAEQAAAEQAAAEQAAAEQAAAEQAAAEQAAAERAAAERAAAERAAAERAAAEQAAAEQAAAEQAAAERILSEETDEATTAVPTANFLISDQPSSDVDFDESTTDEPLENFGALQSESLTPETEQTELDEGFLEALEPVASAVDDIAEPIGSEPSVDMAVQPSVVEAAVAEAEPVIQSAMPAEPISETQNSTSALLASDVPKGPVFSAAPGHTTQVQPAQSSKLIPAVAIAAVGLIGIGAWLYTQTATQSPTSTVENVSQKEKLAAKSRSANPQPIPAVQPSGLMPEKSDKGAAVETTKIEPAEAAKPKVDQVAKTSAQSDSTSQPKPSAVGTVVAKATSGPKEKSVPTVEKVKTVADPKAIKKSDASQGGKTSLLAALQMDEEDTSLDVTKMGPMEGARLEKNNVQPEGARAARLMNGNALEQLETKKVDSLDESKLNLTTNRSSLLDLPGQDGMGSGTGEFPREDVNRIFNRESRAVSDCYKRHLTKGGRPFKRNVTLSFKVAPSGTASTVSIGSKYRRTYMKKCLSRLIGRLKFPPFEGKAETVEFPLKIATRY